MVSEPIEPDLQLCLTSRMAGWPAFGT